MTDVQFAYDVFLSHTSKDKQRVRQLAENLRDQGLRVWFDDWMIKPGDDIYLAIENGLEMARVQVLCISKAALSSDWVALERSTVLFRNPANNQGRRFIPVLLEDCELPGALRRYKYVDLRKYTEAVFNQLLAACLHTDNQPQGLVKSQVISVKSNVLPSSRADQVFPKWSRGTGKRDAWGIVAELNVNGVSQRFRRINPGTFLMGSPASEPERRVWEEQRPVRINQGFWLADTACTQAFWQSVTGDNPSRFRDDLNNPVEQVSWEDVQRFIQSLNQMFPDLKAGLPTETQWEYACRAGTTTPFSFGDAINPDQINYNGQHPYNNGAKGLYRGKTVPVKSLPANLWGLYEMHGNVWEWCADRHGIYNPKVTTNPLGAKHGFLRVMRGGSWFYYGRDSRSADRFINIPTRRLSCIGFRLTLD